MKPRWVVLGILSICLCEYAGACGGGSSSRSNNGTQSSRGGGFAQGSYGSQRCISPMNQSMSQFAMARQTMNARAVAYNAQMRPQRIARAAESRQQNLAQRETRKAQRIAQLDAKRSAQQAFLAQARTWIDRSGDHRLQATLVDANSWGVKLQKQDGTRVNVPMSRLSSPDQSWVAAKLADDVEGSVMLVGL